MIDLGAALTAFALVLPVELPDKTFVASLVLATRYRPLPVWLGVVAAFAVQCAIAVAAGSLVTLLPRRPLLLVTAALFLLGAALLLRGAGGADAQEEAEEREYAGRGPRTATGTRAAAASFGVLFLAEWGDLSQLMTAGLVARTEEPASVFLGSWLALATVAALAVAVGRAVLRRVRLATVRRVGALVALVLGSVTLVEALRAG